MQTEKRFPIPFFSLLVEILWWILIAGALVLLGSLIVLGVLAVSGGDGSPMSVSWESPGLNITFPISGEAEAPPVQMTLLFLAMALILVILGVFILYHLRIISRQLRSGDFFLPDTAGRLSSMAAAMITAGVLTGIFRTVAAWFVASRVDIPGVSLTVKPGFDWTLLFMGVVLAVLAEVFRRGSELQEDNDLTV